MGLVSQLGNIFTGSQGAKAATQAAGQANIFSQMGVDELRQQFGATQEQLAPFIQAGTGALPGVVQGTTAGGLDERLAEIFGTDIFETLRGERTRAVEGQLAAGGLTRSGTALEEAAAIPTDIGMMIEQLLSGRATGLAGMGQQTALNVGQLGGQAAAGAAGLFEQQGQNVASGILGAQQARAAGTENLVNLATTAASIFFSDPALKTDIKPISHIGDLNLYTWDWIPEAAGTMIEKCGTTGFMADEVAAKYPQHVKDFCGFMVIDFPSLLAELEAANAYPC